MKVSDPIMTCAEAAAFEGRLLEGRGAELCAMSRAGEGLARLLLREFGRMLGDSPEILALAGAGHNGGDALCAALYLLKALPRAKLKVFLSSPMASLKPNTAHFAGLLMRASGSVRFVGGNAVREGADLVLEGLLGMSFAPPLRAGLAEIVEAANAAPFRLRASVDIPAGLSEAACGPVFRADVTYMTGIAKAPLFTSESAACAGRLRYVDLGFFDSQVGDPSRGVVSDAALAPLRALRRAQSDKRAYGHLFVFAGCARYPGAALMNARAALRSGVGLVSAFVPESLAPSLAAAEPACIWVPCPETEDGSLSLESYSLFRSAAGRETAVLAGSGLGDSPEALALVSEVAKSCGVPVVLDADAVRPSILDSLAGKPALITPHAGEFLRVARGVSDADLEDFCSSRNLACVLKGPVSRVCDGSKIARVCAGGPQLARAGSGDILAGLAGGLAARPDLGLGLFASACAASLWAGRAAERAFAEAGETAYATSDVFNLLHGALNE